MGLVIAIVLVALGVVVFFASLRIAQEYERGVVFRLGRLAGIRGPGAFFIIPIIDRAVIVDTRTVTVDVEQQETITRDSVTIKVNAVVWYRIVDPVRSVVAVANYRSAVYQVALTTLRNVIGQHDLDEVLQQRDKINRLLRENVADSTTEWGVEVQRFEMKDVELPEAMQQVLKQIDDILRTRQAAHVGGENAVRAGSHVAFPFPVSGGLELKRR